MHDFLVRAHQPEFVVPATVGRFDQRQELLLDAHAIVRMDVFEPGRHVGYGLGLAVPEELFIVVAAPKPVGHQIPIEHGIAGRF